MKFTELRPSKGWLRYARRPATCEVDEMNSGGVMRFARTLTALLGVLLSVVVYGRASGVTQQPPAGEYLLAAGRAGRIELGTSVDEMYQFFGRDNVRLVDLFKEGFFSPALEIKLAGTTVVPSVVTDISEWPCGEFSVSGIDVRDPRFRTKDGFGVGSPAGDLRRSYPFQVSEEEGAHAAIVKVLHMSFSLTRRGPADQQRVTSVWIWPDPDAVRKKRCPGRRIQLDAGRRQT